MLLSEILRHSTAQSLTFKLQAALGPFQKLPVVERGSDHLLEGCRGGKEKEKKEKSNCSRKSCLM